MTIAVHLLGSVDLITSAGHVIVGGWVSLIVTVNEHGATLSTSDLGGAGWPGGSEQVTVVVPIGKSEPGAGTQLIALQSPAVIGAKETAAPHWPVSFDLVMFAGQLSIQGVGKVK